MAKLTETQTVADTPLFGGLPKFPVALPDDELKLLAVLAEWPTVTEIQEHETAACRRLEKRGIVKCHRWKDDPLSMYPTIWAGKLPAASLREQPITPSGRLALQVK